MKNERNKITLPSEFVEKLYCDIYNARNLHELISGRNRGLGIFNEVLIHSWLTRNVRNLVPWRYCDINIDGYKPDGIRLQGSSIAECYEITTRTIDNNSNRRRREEVKEYFFGKVSGFYGAGAAGGLNLNCILTIVVPRSSKLQLIDKLPDIKKEAFCIQEKRESLNRSLLESFCRQSNVRIMEGPYTHPEIVGLFNEWLRQQNILLGDNNRQGNLLEYFESMFHLFDSK